ncbi:phage tail protein I [Burkholderia sp. ISTR5]|uniref:phage tail protein I n=1 Tax=Burkholderia sp. ISTR5 TaxID=2500161 RepID=UPI00136CA6C5|nr:phage tail protein I [Burkholderia sp. ISTR5]NBI45452.1 phage tail protein I [Burkholderia sp. ISTR5]
MSDVASLLPPNATLLEKRAAQAAAGIERVQIPIRDFWKPAACPAEFLPWLAWGFGVDQWDSAWTDAQKRDAIAKSLYVQRHKGTIGAVRAAVATLGFDVTIQEWFNQIPAADPYTFDVLVDSNQVGVDEDAFTRILYVIRLFKNLRSHLRRIKPSITTQGGPVVAGFTTIGHDITIPYSGTQLKDRTLDGSWRLDGTITLSGKQV